MQDALAGLINGLFPGVCLWLFVKSEAIAGRLARAALQVAVLAVASAALWPAVRGATTSEDELFYWAGFCCALGLFLMLTKIRGPSSRTALTTYDVATPAVKQDPQSDVQSCADVSDSRDKDVALLALLDPSCFRDEAGPATETLTVTTFGWLPPTSPLPVRRSPSTRNERKQPEPMPVLDFKNSAPVDEPPSQPPVAVNQPSLEAASTPAKPFIRGAASHIKVKSGS